MASAAMTAKKMKAKVMKIITKALTTTIKIISKITMKNHDNIKTTTIITSITNNNQLID